jgi:hypothetical protein
MGSWKPRDRRNPYSFLTAIETSHCSSLLKKCLCWTQQCTPIVLALGKWRQEDSVPGHQDYIARPCLKKKKRVWKDSHFQVQLLLRQLALCASPGLEQWNCLFEVRFENLSIVILSGMSPLGLMTLKQWVGWKMSKKTLKGLVWGDWS